MNVVPPGGARPRAAFRFFVAAGALIVLAAGAAWWFVATDEPPAANTAMTTDAIESRPVVPPPPFRIRGTVVSGTVRSALISILDDQRREGPERRVAEGEVLTGYRLERIHLHRVYFEKDGARFMLVVGGGRPEPEPESNTIRRADRSDVKATIVPPPPGMDIEAERRKFEELLGKMQQDPKRQEMREQRRREMGDRPEPSPWGARPSPAPAPP